MTETEINEIKHATPSQILDIIQTLALFHLPPWVKDMPDAMLMQRHLSRLQDLID